VDVQGIVDDGGVVRCGKSRERVRDGLGKQWKVGEFRGFAHPVDVDVVDLDRAKGYEVTRFR